MYEKYYVVNEFGEDVGEAWFDVMRCCYVVSVASLGKELTFDTVDEMDNYLWGIGLDAI